MRKFLFGVCILFSFWTAEAQQLVFTYDNSGNQTRRELCLGCTGRKPGGVKDIEDLTKEDLEEFWPGDGISFYPNPVKQTLYLSWENEQGKDVKDISIHSGTGQVLFTSDASSKKNTELLFTAYPQGFYYVILGYNDGSTKSIKIIKD